jgi:hypothetical protein
VPLHGVGVYMQAMIARCVLVRMYACSYTCRGLLDACLYACMRARTHVGMGPYGRRTDRGLKYLFVEDTGSGYFPLP